MEKNIQKNIVIITNSYPFGRGEEFFEKELDYLVSAFHKVIIISRHTSNEQTRSVPNNVLLFRANIKTNYRDIFFAWKYIFDRRFWDEIKNVYSTIKIKVTFKRIVELVHALFYGDALEKYMSNIIDEYNLKNDKLYLYSYWSTFGAYAIAKYKSINPDVIVVARAHGHDLYWERQQSKYIPLRYFLLKYLDRIVFISEHGKKYFQNKLKCLESEKLCVSRLGINNHCSFKERNRNDKFTIVSCSGLISIKRIDLIIKALAKIENYKVYWVHIGDGELMGNIKALAQKLLHNKTNIKCDFKGHISNKEVFEFYNNHHVDVLLNVSKDEGVPVSIMEACSFKIPIIATDVGGVSEIVSEKNGVLLPANPSENEIVDAISLIQALSEEKMNEKKLNAYNTWKTKYNAEVNYLNFTEQLLNIKATKK